MINAATLETALAADHFIKCLERSNHVTQPFDYWLLADPLPEAVCDSIASLPFAPPTTPNFNDGRRETNNSTRVYFSPENQRLFPVCREVADTFRNPRVIEAIEDLTGSQVSRGKLRVEYCQDTDGFWLEPHLDISVKLFTMLIYLSDDPKLYDAGTDIYDASPEHKLVASAPYEFNSGLIFIPGHNTWHGFSKRPINGVRKSIIVNYVSNDWKAVSELC